MAKINYEDKVSISQSALPNKNKVRAEDMNEIKTAINKLTAVKYCTCTTAANVQTKEFVVTDGTQLEAGDILCVKHSNSNTFSYNATNLPQASVNGTTYLVKRNEASPTGTTADIMGAANNYIYYLFDGEKLAWLGHSNDNNTTYSNASLGQGYGTCSTAESTVAKVVTLSSYSLVNGGIVAVKFTYAVPANSTMNVNSKGAKEIWYKGVKITAGVIKAGDLATFIYDGTRYQMISLDSGTGGGGSSADTLPIGSIFNYDGTTVPSGYEEVSDYSTSELKTGANWIDGKPIYRKVVQLSSDLNLNAGAWSGDLISLTNVKMFIDALGLYPGGSTSQIRATVINNNLRIMNPSNSFAIVVKYIVLEYTKTTD